MPPIGGLSVGSEFPPLSQFVPKLKGTDNWSSWKASLSVTLNSIHPKLFQLLTGEYAKPIPVVTTPATTTTPEVLAQPDFAAVIEWHDYSLKLMPWLYATTMPKHHDGHIRTAANAFSAFQSLKQAFGNSRSLTDQQPSCTVDSPKFGPFSNLLSIRYCGTDPQGFLDRWTAALAGAQEASGPLTCRHIYFLFLVAVRNDLDTWEWSKSLKADHDMISGPFLELTYANFLRSEASRLLIEKKSLSFDNERLRDERMRLCDEINDIPPPSY
jgi:hypothetical protein